MAGTPFERGKPGHQQGIDPRTLGRGDRAALDAGRLAHQRHLLRQGIRRFTAVEVNEAGRIHDGHHAVRAAVELGLSVDVDVIAGSQAPSGPPSVEQMPVF